MTLFVSKSIWDYAGQSHKLSYSYIYNNLKSVVMWQKPWSFLPRCQILCHYLPYSYSKAMAQEKNVFFVKMSLISMGSIVPA